MALQQQYTVVSSLLAAVSRHRGLYSPHSRAIGVLPEFSLSACVKMLAECAVASDVVTACVKRYYRVPGGEYFTWDVTAREKRAIGVLPEFSLSACVKVVYVSST